MLLSPVMQVYKRHCAHALCFTQSCVPQLSLPTTNGRVTSVQWSQRHDWLAIAASHGWLQILKHQWIAGRNESQPSNRVVAGLGISYKQNCSGHFGTLWLLQPNRRAIFRSFFYYCYCVSHRRGYGNDCVRAGHVHLSAWNDAYEKIASFDSEGTIIIWQYSGDKFCEIEMNHRSSGHIAIAFEWSPDGLLSCIAYKDGTTIERRHTCVRLFVVFPLRLSPLTLQTYCETIGFVSVASAQGMLWSIEQSYLHIAWSPDARSVALASRDGIIRVYGARDGVPIVSRLRSHSFSFGVFHHVLFNLHTLRTKADVPVVSREETQQEIVCVRWYTGQFISTG